MAKATRTGARRGAAALALDAFGAEPEARPCDSPGCALEGAHRAPKAPDRLDDYHWFCLEHARAYNKSWNFHAGMSEAEMERAIRRSVTWERPSWPFGARRRAARAFADGAFADPLGVFGRDPAGPGRRGGAGAGARANGPAPGTEEARALAVMGLSAPVTLEEVKARYKELAMRDHPDRNGGDRRAEERLKSVNGAYTTLKRFLSRA